MGLAKRILAQSDPFQDPEFRAYQHRPIKPKFTSGNPTITMAFTAPVKGSGDFTPVAAGSHHAICYGVVDLGTQDSGQFEPSHKVLLMWELPNERIDVERDGKRVNLPRAQSQKYTLSMHKKANLRATLESWRARPFTDEEAAEFDISNLIGVNCMLTIVHAAGTGKNAGRTYANVRGVSPLPKGMEKRKLENPPLLFVLADFDGRTIQFPQNMPEWIQETIMKSEEYRARTRGHQPPSDADDFGQSLDAARDESFETAAPASRSRPAPTDDGSAFGSKDEADQDVPF